MFRRISTLISKDLVYSFREQILIYGLVAPLVIAVALRLFIPSVENIELTFAVERSTPVEFAAQLEDYGKVEWIEGVAALQDRVLQFDDVPGIYVEGGEYRVLLEGNEESYVQELPGIVIDQLVSGSRQLSVSEVNRGASSSMAREYSAIMMILTSIMIGGMAMGYSIVNERENKTINALAVAPLSTSGYLAGKSLFGVAAALVLSFVTATIIMGMGAIDHARMVVTIASSLGLGLIFGYVLGLTSANQLVAIVVTKGLALPYVIVPLVVILAPGLRFHWIMYPLPVYWASVALQRVFIHPELPIVVPNLLAVATSLLFVALLLPRVGRVLHLRR